MSKESNATKVYAQLTVEVALCCKSNQATNQKHQQDWQLHLRYSPVTCRLLELSSMACRHLQLFACSSSIYRIWIKLDWWVVCQAVANHTPSRYILCFPQTCYFLYVLLQEKGVDLIGRSSTIQIYIGICLIDAFILAVNNKPIRKRESLLVLIALSKIFQSSVFW